MWVMRKDCYVNAAQAITSTIYGQGGQGVLRCALLAVPFWLQAIKMNDFSAE